MSNEQILGYLLHLSYNFWGDRPNAQRDPSWQAQPYLRCDDEVWRDVAAALSAAHFNMVVIDLGDGVKYRSHPEIAVENAWTTQRLRDELGRLRDLGLEPIPKLNFATAHDIWLGDYGRMVSTPQYYQVCRDLIAETCELFDGPRLFHLGMDEEDAGNQRDYLFAAMRQHDLWWHDLNFLVGEVEKQDARAWVWSDKTWNEAAEFCQKMSHRVLQGNWYYHRNLDEPEHDTEFANAWARKCVQGYRTLDEANYEQVLTCSNCYVDNNCAATVEWARQRLNPDNTKGFLVTPWVPTTEEFRAKHFAVIAQMKAALETQA